MQLAKPVRRMEMVRDCFGVDSVALVYRFRSQVLGDVQSNCLAINLHELLGMSVCELTLKNQWIIIKKHKISSIRYPHKTKPFQLN